MDLGGMYSFCKASLTQYNVFDVHKSCIYQ